MSVAIAEVGAGDRFSFTLFLALAVHALIVFGITFVNEDPKPASHTMEITLAQFDDGEKPEKADFLAQTNQQGSGSEAEKAKLSSPTPTQMTDVEVRDAARPVPELTTPVVPRPQAKSVVTTSARSSSKTALHINKPKERDAPVAKKRSLLQRSLEIASLEAQLDQQKRSYARRPRVTRVTSASTMKTPDAYYVKEWHNKIERVGNLNYPEKARQQAIYGTVRLMVALYANGTVKEVELLQSSGYKILDDAAIRTVRLAAPFSPFPDSVRKDKDVLEIIRTWSFQKRGLSSY